jgi:hypothetical protein
MKINSAIVVSLLLVGLAGFSCGSSTGGVADGGGGKGGDAGGGAVGTSSGLPRASTLGSLTTAQDATLCDWENAKQGGYGRSVSCPNGSEDDTDLTQASCVASVPGFATGCPSLTVGDVEDCANAIGTNLCQMPTAAGCANVNACLQ